MEKLKWHTERRKINELIPFEANPRQMTKKQVEDLKRSVEKFGLVEIPAIDLDNKIIAGHQRLKIMQILGRGEETIDARLPNRKLTETEFKEYCIRSNKNSGEWDYGILKNEFDAGELEGFGFDPDGLNQEFFKVQEDTLKDFMAETDYDTLSDNTQDRRKEGQTQGRIVICGFEVTLAEPAGGQLIEYIRALRREPEEKRMDRSERFIEAVMEVVNEGGLSKTGAAGDQRATGPAEENAEGTTGIQDSVQPEDHTPGV